MDAPQTGQRVRSSELGPGVVRGITPAGAVRVHFELTDTVEAVHPATLSLIDAPPASEPALTSPPPAAPIPLKQIAAPELALDERRLTVECLRQGLPPPGKLTSWTFGQQTARQALERAIGGAVRGTGSVLLVRAAYGQGKSHLGRLGRDLALEQGLMTMHVELDGRGVSLREGTRVIAELFASARLPGANAADSDHLIPGLATLLRRAATGTKGRLPASLELFQRFLKEPSLWVESEPAVQILEYYLSGLLNAPDSTWRLSELIDRYVRLPPLRMAYGSMAARQFAQASQLGRVVELAGLAGARGAFVVIDELDHDATNDRDRRVTEMLGRLAYVASRSRMVLLLLGVDQRWQNLADVRTVALDPLRYEDVVFLVNKAVDAYASAFPSPAFAAGRDELIKRLVETFNREYAPAGWGPRYFVRAAIEACELARSQNRPSLADVRFS